MGQELIRLLKAEEIECRVSVINERGLSLLLYKDARVDQRILDETFGAFGWKRSHQCIEGNLYCTVEILDRETGQWVSKQDVGTTGYTEKEKSQASDSFKRACFNWGIGRELYSAPFIWVPAAMAGIQEKNGKYCTYERFSVSMIAYNDSREIVALEIVNSRGAAVYSLQQKTGSRKQQQKEGKAEKVDKAEKAGKAGNAEKAGNVDMAKMTGKAERAETAGKTGNVERAEKAPQEMAGQGTRQDSLDRQDNGDNQNARGSQEQEAGGIGKKQELILLAELNRTGVTLEEVLGRYKITSLSQMSPDIYKRALSALRASKPKTKAARTAA